MELHLSLVVAAFLQVLTMIAGHNVAGRTVSSTEKYDVMMITGGSVIQRRNPSTKQTIDIYCYPGVVKNLIYLFQSVKLHIKSDSDDYRLYMSGTPREVFAAYLADSYGWSINPFRGKQPNTISLDPFNTTCLTVSTNDRYNIELQVIVVDLWRALMMSAGLTLVLVSGALSGNPVFFYLCGVVVGVCASFMLLVYYLSKLWPKKVLTYSIMVGGWTVGAFILQQVWSNLATLALGYRTHVFWYTMVVGAVSFAACYRIGPPQDARSRNLVMWVLQVIGALLIFFSSSYQEASTAVVIIALLLKYFPQRWTRAFKAYWIRRFPPKRKLLSNEEYYEQGARETKKALDELRQHCSSPDCAQWRIMLKLNDSKRFASFVEGESHLSDDEVLSYESYAFNSLREPEYSSDSDEESISEDED